MGKNNKFMDAYRSLKVAQILSGVGSVTTGIATLIAGITGNAALQNSEQTLATATENLKNAAKKEPAYVRYLDDRERQFMADMESGKLSESLGKEWIDNLHGVEGVLDYYYYFSPRSDHASLDDEIEDYKTANKELDKKELGYAVGMSAGAIGTLTLASFAFGCSEKKRELLDE